jgi:hypothetical protein
VFAASSSTSLWLNPLETTLSGPGREGRARLPGAHLLSSPSAAPKGSYYRRTGGRKQPDSSQPSKEALVVAATGLSSISPYQNDRYVLPSTRLRGGNVKGRKCRSGEDFCEPHSRSREQERAATPPRRDSHHVETSERSILAGCPSGASRVLRAPPRLAARPQGAACAESAGRYRGRLASRRFSLTRQGQRRAWVLYVLSYGLASGTLSLASRSSAQSPAGATTPTAKARTRRSSAGGSAPRRPSGSGIGGTSATACPGERPLGWRLTRRQRLAAGEQPEPGAWPPPGLEMS